MTLVVARVRGGAVHLLGDTKLSFEDLVRAKELSRGALKCIAISPNTAIAFAGERTVAEAALAPIFSNPAMSRESIRKHLLANCRGWNSFADFIIATADNPHPFDRIVAGQLENELDAAWIGDAAAFQELQSLSLSADYKCFFEPDDFIYSVDQALTTIIRDGAFESVGGFKTRLSARHDSPREPGFRYQTYAEAFDMRPVENTTEPTSLLRSRGAEGGSYRYVVNAPAESGIGAVGVYIAEARTGVLYYPQFDWNSHVYIDVDYNRFIETVRSEAGIVLTGIGFS